MITIIDFEASGLEIPESYPIEVGIAQIDDDQNITSWSSLIRREPTWTHWSDQSENIHGIARETLAERGQEAYDVAMILNATLGDSTALCDGHRFDVHWAERLYAAAGIERTWKIASYDIAIYGNKQVSYETIGEVIELQRRTKTPHRAGEDARILAELFLDCRAIIENA